MRALLGSALSAVIMLSGVVGPADAQDPRPRRASSLSIAGNGYGHGHGLSQHGAQSAAGRGLSHQQILKFYYPKLTKGSVGGNVSVLITADTTTDVMVQDRSSLTVKSLGNGSRYRLNTKAARWWRLLPVKNGRRTRIDFRGARGWKTLRSVPGEAQFDAGGRPLTLRTPAGKAAYRGVLRSAVPSSAPAARDTVNVVSLENYLKGVVPREVPAQWEPAAVRAQAVAARTYAAFERRQPLASHYQICDTSLCQVYGGYWAEQPESNRAIDATKKFVLLAGGKPAFTQFSASNGGYTSAGSFNYLPAKKDPYDTAYRGWTDTITAAEVEAALPAIGDLTSAEVLERDGNGAYGGRVVRIRINGSRTSTVLSGDTFRSYFGLRSTMFDVSAS